MALDSLSPPRKVELDADLSSSGGSFADFTFCGSSVDLIHAAPFEPVGEHFKVFEAEQVRAADEFTADAEDDASLAAGHGFLGDGVGGRGGSRNEFSDDVCHARREAADKGRLQRALQLRNAGEVALHKAKHRQGHQRDGG